MSERITVASVSEGQWLTNSTDRQGVVELVTHGQGMLMRENDGSIVVFDGEEWEYSTEQAVPLSFACVVNGHLVDARSLLTDEDKKRYPAMLCEAAGQSGGKLALKTVLADLIRVLTEVRESPRPAYSPELTASILAAQDMLSRIRYVGDLRMKSVLETLVVRVEAELPTEFEAIHAAAIPEGKARQRYYALHHILYSSHTLLHWYTVKTLYIVKTVSLNSSVGTRYDILSCDRHRAEVEFAALYAWNRPYDADCDRWELLANDTPVRVAKRLEQYPDLYDLSSEWDERTDEEIIYWRK